MKEFKAIFEKSEGHFIGYCPEVPEANGLGKTLEECKKSLTEAIRLVYIDRLEDGLSSVPQDAYIETLVVN